MSTYILQLLADLEAAILARWKECPPHYFEMGLPDQFLDSPAGYDGPPFGFGLKEEGPTTDFTWQDEEGAAHQSSVQLSESEKVIENLDFERSISEMEQCLEESPPKRWDMYYHFGFVPEQFPPVHTLADEELDVLVESLCRFWAAYNFTPVFPERTPGRILYPLLLERMYEPTFVMTKGNRGIEFCSYELSECPFGEKWCDCKVWDSEVG
jgi:hypothetical protein